MGDRLARTARHAPELRLDDGLRHLAHRRVQLPLHPIHAAAGRGAGHSDRYRRWLHRHALSLRAQSGRRRRQRIAGAVAPARTKIRPLVAQEIEKNVADWWETVERQAMTDSEREGFVNPQRLVWELSARLPANAIVAADSGSAANWYARHLKLGRRSARLPLGHAGHHGPGRALRDRGQVRPP